MGGSLRPRFIRKIRTCLGDVRAIKEDLKSLGMTELLSRENDMNGTRIATLIPVPPIEGHYLRSAIAEHSYSILKQLR